MLLDVLHTGVDFLQRGIARHFRLCHRRGEKSCRPLLGCVCPNHLIRRGRGWRSRSSHRHGIGRSHGACGLWGCHGRRCGRSRHGRWCDRRGNSHGSGGLPGVPCLDFDRLQVHGLALLFPELVGFVLGLLSLVPPWAALCGCAGG